MNFKIVAARFRDVSHEKKKTNKINCSCSDNHLSNYTKTIIHRRLSEYCRIIPLIYTPGVFLGIIQLSLAD